MQRLYMIRRMYKELQDRVFLPFNILGIAHAVLTQTYLDGSCVIENIIRSICLSDHTYEAALPRVLIVHIVFFALKTF